MGELFSMGGLREMMAEGEESFQVTPWKVEGKVDYDRLIELFGTSRLEGPVLERLTRLLGGELPPSLRRGIYYSHRDLPWILDEYEKGNRFFLYTGRGPSGDLHLGHLLPFELCSFLQRRLGVDLWIQITDDEKFLFKRDVSLEETYRLGMENLYDLLAPGFDPRKVHILFDTRSIRLLYPIALEVARRVTFSTARAVFGFTPENNIGSIFYTALQSAPAFLPSQAAKRKIPCLIPCGIDQDPHFRVTRDVAEPLGYPKPALLHNMLIPGLLGTGKMSSSSDAREGAIYLNDSPQDVKRKLSNAFTGGRATVAEQRKLGAIPEICSIWALWRSRFAEKDEEFEGITQQCRSGGLLCGECKARLIPKVQKHLEEHAKAREAVKSWAESAIVEQL